MHFNIPSWVINLDSDVKRWDKVSQHLQDYGVQFQRMPAVNARGSEIDSYEANMFCTKVMIACFESHRACWKKIVEDNIAVATIFEDDVELTDSDFVRKRALVLQNTPSDADIILLGCFLCRYQDNDLFSKLFMTTRGLNRKEYVVNDYLYVPKSWSGTHAYCVTQKGARKLLEYFPFAQYHIDVMMDMCPSLVTYASRQVLAIQDLTGTQSHNSKTDAETQNPLVDSLKIDHGTMNFKFWYNMPILNIDGKTMTVGTAFTTALILLLVVVVFVYFSNQAGTVECSSFLSK